MKLVSSLLSLLFVSLLSTAIAQESEHESWETAIKDAKNAVSVIIRVEDGSDVIFPKKLKKLTALRELIIIAPESKIVWPKSFAEQQQLEMLAVAAKDVALPKQLNELSKLRGLIVIGNEIIESEIDAKSLKNLMLVAVLGKTNNGVINGFVSSWNVNKELSIGFAFEDELQEMLTRAMHHRPKRLFEGIDENIMFFVNSEVDINPSMYAFPFVKRLMFQEVNVEFGDLSNMLLLENFEAKDCQSTGELDFSGLMNLEKVKVEKTGITSFPKGLVSLPKLRYVKVKHNAITQLTNDVCALTDSSITITVYEKSAVEIACEKPDEEGFIYFDGYQEWSHDAVAVPDDTELEMPEEDYYEQDLNNVSPPRDLPVAEDEVEPELEGDFEEPEMPDLEQAEERIFTVVETMPEPPGGSYEEFFEWIIKNLEYPEKELELGIEGTVFIKFVVDVDGSITDVDLQEGTKELNSDAINQAAIDVIKKSPKWSPGTQAGKPVRVYYRLPVKFKLTEPEKD
ncbi:MAG: energy transducer TonB [Bacteroidetes bacterium]|nr:energy transducer TonB [Bacteroidota bacterium]